MLKRKTQMSASIFQVITSGYLALMMTVFLLYAGTKGFMGIPEAKYSAFMAICGGYVICMFVLLLETHLIGKQKLPSIKRILAESTWVQRLMVIYLAVTWISAIASPYFPVTVIGATRGEGALTITVYVLSFLLVSVYGRIEKWMLPLLSVSVSLFDLLCILQLYGLNPFNMYPEGYDYFGANVHYSGAYLGTIGNVDLVAAFLCLVIPLFWITLVRGTDRRKWLLLFPLGLSLFVLLKMWVLAGLVGIFAGGIVALCAIVPVSDRIGKWLWVLFGCLAVLAVAMLFLFDPGSGLFHEIHLLLRGQAEDSFGSGRIYIWRRVLERIPDRFWLGSGPDTMHLVGLEPFKRFDERLNMLLVAEIDLAHNDYLNILFHQGIFALLAYLAALGFAAKDWLRYARRSAAAAALGGAVLCYCVQAFFSFSLCMVSPYFWVVLALLVITNKQNGGKGNAQKTA